MYPLIKSLLIWWTKPEKQRADHVLNTTWTRNSARARLQVSNPPVCERVCMCDCVYDGGRVGYDLSHCMTPNNKLKPIYEESMRLWFSLSWLLGCLRSQFPLSSYTSNWRTGDISVKVIGIKWKLLISAITVTSGRFAPCKDFGGWAAVVCTHSLRGNQTILTGDTEHYLGGSEAHDGPVSVELIAIKFYNTAKKEKSEPSVVL